MDPPVPLSCLNTPYSAKPGQKGGTLIAEQVWSLEEHTKLLLDPDRYRPDRCESCHCSRLHAHDFRSRRLDIGPPEVVFRRYRCVGCGAVWMVLAGFMARWLHNTWARIQGVLEGAGELAKTGSKEPSVPRRTRYRWCSRAGSCAAVLVQLLAAIGGVIWPSESRSPQTRAEVVDALVQTGKVEAHRKMGAVAGWVHRLAAGIRLL